MVELKTEDELHPEGATTEQNKAVDPVDKNDDNDDLAPDSERDCSEDNDVTVSESQIVMESDESDGEYLVYTGMVISSIDQVMTLNQKCVKTSGQDDMFYNFLSNTVFAFDILSKTTASLHISKSRTKLKSVQKQGEEIRSQVGNCSSRKSIRRLLVLAYFTSFKLN